MDGLYYGARYHDGLDDAAHKAIAGPALEETLLRSSKDGGFFLHYWCR